MALTARRLEKQNRVVEQLLVERIQARELGSRSRRRLPGRAKAVNRGVPGLDLRVREEGLSNALRGAGAQYRLRLFGL